MKVIRASSLGMCFGVKDALEKVMTLEEPERVQVFGELVHNAEVLRRITARGIRSVGEKDRAGLPSAERVVITAHGISEKERLALEAAGKKLIDATCPLVRRVHVLAGEFQSRGYFVVVVGRKDHVEVKGIVGDLEHYAIVETPQDAQAYDAGRIAVISQTTTPPALLDKCYQEIVRKNSGKEISLLNTICGPTRERQEAVEELLPQINALVVVGGKNSNNSQRLAELAKKKGVPCFWVEKPGELQAEQFENYSVVGLTAGTSTMDETI